MYDETSLLKDFMAFLFGRKYLNYEIDYHDSMSIVEEYFND